MSSSRSDWLSSQLPVCLESLVPRWELLVVQTTVPHLVGNPQPLVGNCWRFGQQFPICLGSFPSFRAGHHWQQLWFPICQESVHSPRLGSQVPRWQLVVVCLGPFSWPGHSNWLPLECSGTHVCLSCFVQIKAERVKSFHL